MSAPGNEPPEPAPTPQAGPWAEDIRTALGEDHAAAFDIVDGYMRESVQPRITQLEEGSAPARELWADLQSDPDQALLDLVAARYGDDFVPNFQALFEEKPPEATAAPEADEKPPADAAQLSAEQQELLDWAQTKRAEEQRAAGASEYEAFKKALGEKHGLTERDLNHLDPFIYTSPDDGDAAVAAYKSFLVSSGVQPEVAAEPVPDAPAVLGSEAAPGAPPPVATQYTKFSQLDDALGDFMAEQRTTATPPPVLG